MIVEFPCIRTSIMCKCSKIEISPDSARNVKSQQNGNRCFSFLGTHPEDMLQNKCLSQLFKTDTVVKLDLLSNAVMPMVSIGLLRFQEKILNPEGNDGKRAPSFCATEGKCPTSLTLYKALRESDPSRA